MLVVFYKFKKTKFFLLYIKISEIADLPYHQKEPKRKAKD